MKKELVALMLCMLSISMFGQKIVSDEVIAEGRIIETSQLDWEESKGMNAKFSVARIVDPTDVNKTIEESVIFDFFSMSKKVYLTIPGDAQLHLKLEDGTILSLPIKKAITKEDNKYGKINFAVAGNRIKPQYIISPEAKKVLLKQPVVKLRFECDWNNGYVDVPRDDLDADIFFQQEYVKGVKVIDNKLGVRENRLGGF